jgi:hypothetical protein
MIAARPLTAHVCAASYDGRIWHVMVKYSDGDAYLSRETYRSEAEASEAARTWALENMSTEHTRQ